MAEKFRGRDQATTPPTSASTTSRQMILDAALRLAGERGYVGTTMTLVKRATGLPASSLYWHFSSKDELLAEALEHGHVEFHRKPRWETRPSRPRLYDGLLLNLRRTTSDVLTAEPGFWRMGLIVAIEAGPTVGDGPRERFCQIRTQVLAVLELWWSQAVDLPARETELLARLTLAALDGLFIRLQASGYDGHDALLQRLATGLAAAADRLREPAEVTPAPTPAQVPPRTELDSRARLIEALVEVAATSGYEGASISRICSVAGLPASSLYWHFGGKDDLFASAVRESYRAWGRTQTDWRTPPAADGEWERDLAAKLAVTVAGLHEMPSFLRLGYQLLLPNRAEPLPGRDTFLDVRRMARRDFTEWLRGALGRTAEDPEPDEMGALLLALSDGIAFAETLDHPGFSPALVAQVIAAAVAAPLAVRSARNARTTAAESRH